MMVHPGERCKFHVILICVVSSIKRQYITEMGIVLLASCISLKHLKQVTIHHFIVKEKIMVQFLECI
jgi:hypothetical protein